MSTKGLFFEKRAASATGHFFRDQKGKPDGSFFKAASRETDPLDELDSTMQPDGIHRPAKTQPEELEPGATRFHSSDGDNGGSGGGLRHGTNETGRGMHLPMGLGSNLGKHAEERPPGEAIDEAVGQLTNPAVTAGTTAHRAIDNPRGNASPGLTAVRKNALPGSWSATAEERHELPSASDKAHNETGIVRRAVREADRAPKPPQRETTRLGNPVDGFREKTVETYPSGAQNVIPSVREPGLKDNVNSLIEAGQNFFGKKSSIGTVQDLFKKADVGSDVKDITGGSFGNRFDRLKQKVEGGKPQMMPNADPPDREIAAGQARRALNETSKSSAREAMKPPGKNLHIVGGYPGAFVGREPEFTLRAGDPVSGFNERTTRVTSDPEWPVPRSTNREQTRTIPSVHQPGTGEQAQQKAMGKVKSGLGATERALNGMPGMPKTSSVGTARDLFKEALSLDDVENKAKDLGGKAADLGGRALHKAEELGGRAIDYAEKNAPKAMEYIGQKASKGLETLKNQNYGGAIDKMIDKGMDNPVTSALMLGGGAVMGARALGGAAHGIGRLGGRLIGRKPPKGVISQVLDAIAHR